MPASKTMFPRSPAKRLSCCWRELDSLSASFLVFAVCPVLAVARLNGSGSV